MSRGRRSSKADERRRVERRAGQRRVEDKRGSVKRPPEQRRYPRREHDVRVHAFKRGKGGKRVDFSATMSTRDLSIGGAYLVATFMLKVGLELEFEFELPGGRTVHANAEVVHVIDNVDATEDKPSGFAVRFNEYHGESEIIMRAFLARGDLRDFVANFASKNLKGVKKGDHERLVEMIVRWEMLQEALGR